MTDPVITQPQDNEQAERERLAGNAQRILRITAIAAAVTGVIATVATIAVGEYTFIGSYLMSGLAIIGLFGLWMHRRGRPFAGIVMVALAVMLVGMSIPFLTNGAGINIALAVIILVAGLSSYALPARYLGRMLILAVGAGALTILFDLFTPFYITKSHPVITPVLGGLLTLMYAIYFIRRFRSFTMRFKLIIVAILIAVIPLILLTGMGLTISTRELSANARTSLTTLAGQTDTSLDLYFSNQKDIVSAEAHMPQFVEFLTLTRYTRPQELNDDVAAMLATLQRRDPGFITSYALIDRYGRDSANTNEAEIGEDKSAEIYFTTPAETGLPFISPMLFSPETGTASIFISAPVLSQGGEFLGVISVQLDASILQSLLVSVATEDERMSDISRIILVDPDGFIIMAHTGDPQLVGKTYLPLDDEQVTSLQASRRLPAGAASQLSLSRQDIADLLASTDAGGVFTALSDLGDQVEMQSAPARAESTRWIVIVQQPTSAATDPVNSLRRGAILLTLISVISAGLLALFLANFLLAPVSRLTEAARAITGGDLSARAPVETSDEIGALAYAFNQMTDQLRETLTGLEQRVAARTADLETATRQSQERAERLGTINEVARAIATEQNTETLLPLIAGVVSERFGFYHVGIFLLDDEGKFAVLRAANSEGGRRMLERSHRLQVGQEGIVGFVTETRKARIALDVGEDAVFFNNPDLPDTRSEMALPLILRGKVIGALDVQSTEPQAFGQEDIDTLGILAAQVAVAIDNARLFGETRNALAEAQALYSEYIGQEWQSLARQQSPVGFIQGQSGGKVLDRPVDRDEIRQAITTGDLTISNDGHPVIAVPLKLRDQTIGVIDIRAPEAEHTWSLEEIDLVREVANRVALAMENARLLEETRQRATRERMVADITTKIRSTNDPQEMIRTAVEELRVALQASRVEVVPHKTSPDQDA